LEIRRDHVPDGRDGAAMTDSKGTPDLGREQGNGLGNDSDGGASRKQPRPFMAELQLARRQRGTADGGESGRNNLSGRRPLQPTPSAGSSAGGVADIADVLSSVIALHEKLDRFLTLDHAQIEQVQSELADISGRIKSMKMEIAAIRHPRAQEDRFHRASMELNAVVASTESATHGIMEAAERIDGGLRALLETTAEPNTRSQLESLSRLVISIYEACNFQDLTGQRINKVVRTLLFIEERVDAMIKLWDPREFEAMPLPEEPWVKRDEQLDLTGPASAEDADAGKSISQAEIDALFD